MAKDFSLIFAKVSIKNAPNSNTCFIVTSDITEVLWVALLDGATPHTVGLYPIEELENNPTLDVELKFKDFKWNEL